MKLFLWVWLATAVAAFGETQFAFTNFAGLPGASGTSDGTNSGARFAGPFSTGRENTGDLCVADYYNHTIRRVSAAAVVTTFAGTALASGTNDGPISSARFYQPDGVAEDSAGNLYVADTSNHTIRKIAAGMVSTFAGAPGQLGIAN